MDIFQNLEAAQIFINHDPEFFSLKTNFNYVALEMSRNNFNAALNALKCGVDPAILFNGRNALDVILAVIELEAPTELYFRVGFSARHQLLKQLNSKYPKLKESFTFDNYELACNEKRIKLAESILLSGEIVPTAFYQKGNNYTSPLSKAILSKDLNLISLACDQFLESLTFNQLRHAKDELTMFIKTLSGSKLDLIQNILIKIRYKVDLSE